MLAMCCVCAESIVACPRVVTLSQAALKPVCNYASHTLSDPSLRSFEDMLTDGLHDPG